MEYSRAASNRVASLSPVLRLAVFLLGAAVACGGGDSTGPPPNLPPGPPPPPPSVTPEKYFSAPIAGSPMREVFYGAYFDQGGRDYECQFKWKTGHKGTDILLRNFRVQDSGVAVLAAAPGTVFLRADGQFDRNTWNEAGRPANYVAIEHGTGGPISYYYHLRRGSIRVTLGAAVNRGDTLGLVGSSGDSNWPHLHFEVYERSVVLDPFRGDCNPNRIGLTWQDQLPWQGAFAVLDAGISGRDLSFAELLERPMDVARIPSTAPVVAFWANLYNIRASATRTVLLDAAGTIVDQVSTGAVGTFSTIFLTASFGVNGLQRPPGEYAIALLITDGTEREVARRTFTLEPGAVPAPGRGPAADRPRRASVWLSPPGGETRR